MARLALRATLCAITMALSCRTLASAVRRTARLSRTFGTIGMRGTRRTARRGRTIGTVLGAVFRTRGAILGTGVAFRRTTLAAGTPLAWSALLAGAV